MRLRVLPEIYSVCRLEPEASIPSWAKGQFVSITYTQQELSIVCTAQHVPQSIHSEGPWRILEVAGPLEFSMVGVLANLSQVLAQANISIFVISTFDTDYVLVKKEHLEVAIQALRQAGHQISLAI